MIDIRTFSPVDRDGVVSVILPIQQEEFGVPVTLEQQGDLLDIPAFYQCSAGNFWVAVDGPQVVGAIGLLDIGDGSGALRKMFVRKEYRGSSSGVASRLLATLIEWSNVHSFDAIYLGTTAQFLAAHRFYEKSGFTEVQRTELPSRFPIMAVDTRFYRRGSLSPRSARTSAGFTG